MFVLRASNQDTLDNQELARIVRPIQDEFDVRFFHFARVYNNSRFISYSTRPDVSNEVFQQLQKNGKPLYLTMLNEGIYLSGENPVFNEAIRVMSKANIGNGISFIKQEKDYKEVFGFAGDIDRLSFKESLINNINVLESFCVYFKDKAKELIEKAENKNIKLPKALNYDYLPLSEKIQNTTALELPTKRFYINNQLGYVTFSQQESRCFKLWMLGYTNSQISQIIGITTNAVNSYLQRVKDKLDCKTRVEVIEAARKINLISFPFLHLLS